VVTRGGGGIKGSKESAMMFSNGKKWMLTAAIAGAMTALSAVEAKAGFTEIGKGRKAEANQEQILEHTYGGNFVANGANFSNGSVTATRVDDGNDAVFSSTEITSARTVAAFAKRKQAFGYFGGSSGGAFQKLFDVSGTSGFDVGGTADGLGSVLDGSIRFSRSEKLTKAFSSLASENRDGRDHMITYKVTGLEGQTNPVYLMFWEDKWGRRSDFDFNDLVVEVKGASGEPLLIPLPAAAWSGLGSLAGLGMLMGWKRARRWGG
jgi:hypothetical protein